MASQWQSIFLFVFIVSVSAVSVVWARYGSDKWSPSRRSFCGWQGESCYSTDQCCKPFVCAAFDETGANIDVPGLCMREKDLKACDTDEDCRDTERCAKLDGIASLYCIPRPASRIHGHSRVVTTGGTGGGGLGASCVTSLDCKPHTDNGVDKLCCQKVQLGRQGSKVICDKITARSTCITS